MNSELYDYYELDDDAKFHALCSFLCAMGEAATMAYDIQEKLDELIDDPDRNLFEEPDGRVFSIDWNDRNGFWEFGGPDNQTLIEECLSGEVEDGALTLPESRIYNLVQFYETNDDGDATAVDDIEYYFFDYFAELLYDEIDRREDMLAPMREKRCFWEDGSYEPYHLEYE